MPHILILLWSECNIPLKPDQYVTSRTGEYYIPIDPLRYTFQPISLSFDVVVKFKEI